MVMLRNKYSVKNMQKSYLESHSKFSIIFHVFLFWTFWPVITNSHLENQAPGFSKGKVPNIFRNSRGACWPATGDRFIAVISVHIKWEPETHFCSICRNVLARGNCGLMRQTQNDPSAVLVLLPALPPLCCAIFGNSFKNPRAMARLNKSLRCSWRDISWDAVAGCMRTFNYFQGTAGRLVSAYHCRGLKQTCFFCSKMNKEHLHNRLICSAMRK